MGGACVVWEWTCKNSPHSFVTIKSTSFTDFPESCLWQITEGRRETHSNRDLSINHYKQNAVEEKGDHWDTQLLCIYTHKVACLTVSPSVDTLLMSRLFNVGKYKKRTCLLFLIRSLTTRLWSDHREKIFALTHLASKLLILFTLFSASLTEQRALLRPGVKRSQGQWLGRAAWLDWHESFFKQMCESCGGKRIRQTSINFPGGQNYAV